MIYILNLFTTLLTPKKNEIVVYIIVQEDIKDGAKALFEDNLKKSFLEIHRVLKPNGIAVIVYATNPQKVGKHSSILLLDSGLIMTGAWPLNTEMGGTNNRKKLPLLPLLFISSPAKWNGSRLGSIIT